MNLERGICAAEIQNGTNSVNGGKDSPAATPKIKDIIGKALSKIGAYKQLDNTRQVVALIDDVSN